MTERSPACLHRGRWLGRVAEGIDQHDCQATGKRCVPTDDARDFVMRSAVLEFVSCESCPLYKAIVTDNEKAFGGLPWGKGESISGPGSSLQATEKVRQGLSQLLTRLSANSLLDIPCGDFNWMQAADLQGATYIGADIVREIIDQNKLRYPDRDFRHLDLVCSPLPTVDVVFTRDCLVHLPYFEIGQALQNIVASGAKWLVTTHFPGRTNHNIKLGSWRPLDLTAAPFHLPPPADVIDEGCVEGKGAYADKSLGVWSIDSIRTAVGRLNTTPKLTIGMATLADWPGVWATVESIFLHHPDCLPEIEFVIVDNDPAGKPDSSNESDHGSKARRLVDSINQYGGRAKYLHYTKVQGTAAAKEQIFELATGDTVMVVDSHVMFPAGVIRKLIDWSESHPDSKDLWQGPVIGLNQTYGTNFAPRWGSMMFGQWHSDPRILTGNPFEIEMQGCGCFAIRRNAWPGFHPLLLKAGGFGPEEFHLHQRIRRNKGKCWCLPWLRWCHRFGNPGGRKSPGGEAEKRLRGHLLTLLDTGTAGEFSIDSIRQHFVEETKSLKIEKFEEIRRATEAMFCVWVEEQQAAAGPQPEPPKEIPPIWIRGWNFAAAMTRWTLAGMPRRSQAEIDERLKICQACPSLVNSQCEKCGCTCVEANQVINKLALATEKCPMGKWE